MLKTFGGWTFGGRDNWRSGIFPSRLLAAGTFGAFKKAYLPGHFLVGLLVLLVPGGLPNLTYPTLT